MNTALTWLRSKSTLWVFLGLIIIDRVLKLLAISEWAHDALRIKPWLVFALEHNTGIAWGLASSDAPYMKLVLIVVMALALTGIAYKSLLEWCAGNSTRNEILIIIGGLSNLIDRIQYGAVVDFVQIFIGNYRLSVFNLADVYIVAGLAFILKKAWINGNF